MARLNIGLIGLGRLGRVYARDLAGRIPETRLVAVADTIGTLARDIAEEFEVQHSYTDPMALVDDPGAVRVTESFDERGPTYHVTVGPGELGKVIGRGGRTAKAIRTVVRAAAFRDGWAPAPVATHTYIFPTQVIASSVMRPSASQ